MRTFDGARFRAPFCVRYVRVYMRNCVYSYLRVYVYGYVYSYMRGYMYGYVYSYVRRFHVAVSRLLGGACDRCGYNL